MQNYLVAIKTTLCKFFFSLSLKGENDQSNIDVDDHEGEYNDKDNKIDGQRLVIISYWSFINFCCINCSMHCAATKIKGQKVLQTYQKANVNTQKYDKGKIWGFGWISQNTVRNCRNLFSTTSRLQMIISKLLIRMAKSYDFANFKSIQKSSWYTFARPLL